MISIEKMHTVFKPKEKISSKGDRIVLFSLGNSVFDKTNNSWTNKGFINVVAKTNQLISDRDKVKISKITGIDTTEFNGKQNVTIFVELEGENQTDYNETSQTSYEAISRR